MSGFASVAAIADETARRETSAALAAHFRKLRRVTPSGRKSIGASVGMAEPFVDRGD
jgi:hypothetical protein